MITRYIIKFSAILLSSLQIVHAIHVYDVRADDEHIGSQTAVISWVTDTTPDGRNSTIRGFRIDANYLLSKKGNEILDPKITNTTLKHLRSGVTYRACVIILLAITDGDNYQVNDNTACVSFTTDFVAINSYSLTALGIGVGILILFMVTQLINIICPRKGIEGFVQPRKKSEGELEEGVKEKRRKSRDQDQHATEPNKKARGGKQKRKKKSQHPEPKKQQRDIRQKERRSRRTDLDGSKGGGGKHKSVKA